MSRVVVLLLFALASLAPAVRAEDVSLANRALYERAHAQFKEGRYQAACSDFMQLWSRGAYRQSGGLALALAQCHRQQGKRTEALYFFEQAAFGYRNQTSEQASNWCGVIAEDMRPVVNNLVRASIRVPAGTRQLTVDGQPLVALAFPTLRERFPGEDWGQLGQLSDGCFAQLVDGGAALADMQPVASLDQCRGRDGRSDVAVVLSTTEGHVLEMEIEAEDQRAVRAMQVVGKKDLVAEAGKSVLIDATRAAGRLQIAVNSVNVKDEEITLELTALGEPRAPAKPRAPYLLIPHDGRIVRNLAPGQYALRWKVPGDVVVKDGHGRRQDSESKLLLLPGEQASDRVNFSREEPGFIGSVPFWLLTGAVAIGLGVGSYCLVEDCSSQQEPETGTLNWRIEVPK